MLISRDSLKLLKPKEFDKWVDAFRRYFGITTKNAPIPNEVWERIGKISGVGIVENRIDDSECTIYKILKDYPRSSILWSAIWMVICKKNSDTTLGAKKFLNNVLYSSAVSFKDLLKDKSGPIEWLQIKALSDNWLEYAKDCEKTTDSNVTMIFLRDALDFWSNVLYGVNCDFRGCEDVTVKELSRHAISYSVADVVKGIQAYERGDMAVEDNEIANKTATFLEQQRYDVFPKKIGHEREENEIEKNCKVHKALDLVSIKDIGSLVRRLLNEADLWKKKRDDFEALERGEKTVAEIQKFFFDNEYTVNEYLLPACDACLFVNCVSEWIKGGFKNSAICMYISMNATHIYQCGAIVISQEGGGSDIGLLEKYHKCISYAVECEADDFSYAMDGEKTSSRFTELKNELDETIDLFKQILETVKSHKKDMEESSASPISTVGFDESIAKIHDSINKMRKYERDLNKEIEEYEAKEAVEREAETLSNFDRDLEEAQNQIKSAERKGIDHGEALEIKRGEAIAIKERIEPLISKIEAVLSDVALKTAIGEEKCALATAVLGKLRDILELAQAKINNPELGEDEDPDVLGISDEAWTIKCDETVVDFSLLPEELNELAFSRDKNGGKDKSKYDYTAYHELVDAAVDVKRQPVFGDYGRISEYQYFKPFEFQIESVRTMLSRFEGRGIFGEQVGLGKTIEALMTAKVMHECGAIRNAVIIVKNAKQWEAEAKNKFRVDVEKNGVIVTEPMFDIYTLGFEDLINDLELDNKSDSDRLRVYLITLDQIKRGGKNKRSGKEIIEETNKISDYKYNAQKKFSRETLVGIDDMFAFVKDEYISTPHIDVEYISDEKSPSMDGSDKKVGFYNIAKLENIASLLIGECVEKIKEVEKEHLVTSSFYKTKVALIGRGGDTEFSKSYSETVNGIILRDDDTNAYLDESKSLEERRKKIADKIGYTWSRKAKPEIVIFDEGVSVFEEAVSQIIEPKNEDISNLLREYNKKLLNVIEHIRSIEAKIKEESVKNLYEKPRFIDLLIFDEVQELLEAMKKNNDSEEDSSSAEVSGKKENKEALELIHEFIARIQKKYCVLLSATPIKDDLSDIFNLLYMVDKERLGETKEKAKTRFYDTYCGGKRSLSEMAEECSSDSFKLLNGLINSMFTRQRFYDKGVKNSMKRKTATEEEVLKAQKYEHRRNAESGEYKDYGGKKFLRLISVEYSYAKDSDTVKAILDEDKFGIELSGDGKALRKGLLDLKKDFYGENTNTTNNKDFLRAIDGIYQSVKVFSDINNLKADKRAKDFGVKEVDVCGAFIQMNRLLEKVEKRLDEDSLTEDEKEMLKKDARQYVRDCDLLCGYINRGLLDFYKKRHSDPVNEKGNDGRRVKGERGFSTTFLADYVDWTRPYKKGIAIECDNAQAKVNYVIDALLPDESGDQYAKSLGLTDDDILDIQLGKLLVYESSVDRRRKIYNSVQGKDRLIFINRDSGDAALKDDEKKIKASQRDKNVREFSENTLENWNSIYFIHKNQLVGTDFNTANILILNQLDDDKGRYLEPLEVEQAIGRISRVGQTEVCKVCTTLYNGNDEKNNLEFNKRYYEILSDKDGFDLVGACQTEVSFVVPVVMAFLRRLFDINYQYSTVDEDKFKRDKADFKVVRKPAARPRVLKERERFTDILKFAIENEKNLDVYYKDTECMTPFNAIKKMIQEYSSILRHKNDGSDA